MMGWLNRSKKGRLESGENRTGFLFSAKIPYFGPEINSGNVE
jgi:hypothetical protein